MLAKVKGADGSRDISPVGASSINASLKIGH